MRAQLPTYALYGEAGRGAVAEWLHCESIAARSQLHDWEIRPHRHESLFQILYIRRGLVEVTLEGGGGAVRGPHVVTVPPLAPHGFRFEPAIEGWVVTVREQHLRALLVAEPALLERLWRPQGSGLDRRDAAARDLDRAVQTLRDEFAGHGAWRALAVDAALSRLAVALARVLPEGGAAGGGHAPERAVGHVQRYRTLVEQHFREQPTLAALAAQLGITPTQLNRVCHQVLGHAALGVLHQRLLLEAQRDLAYTTMSVKQVALGLGFADAGYFTRFFQRHTGATPTAWRAQAAR